MPVKRLSHVNRKGKVRMVNVASKPVTMRRALAFAGMKLTPAIAQAIRSNTVTKGSVLETARVAGIQAAKKTSDLIPLCHPLPISHVSVEFALKGVDLEVRAEVTAEAKTGVEMEALTAASVAALVVYDMCKGIDKGMAIGPIELLEKEGGKSGMYRKGK